VNRKSPYQLVEQWEALCSCFVNGRRQKDRELQVLHFNPFLEEAKGGVGDVSKTRRRWVTSSDFLDSDSANTTRLQPIHKDEPVNQILVKQTRLTKGCF
jgi:hypothetical protein